MSREQHITDVVTELAASSTTNIESVTDDTVSQIVSESVFEQENVVDAFSKWVRDSNPFDIHEFYTVQEPYLQDEFSSFVYPVPFLFVGTGVVDLRLGSTWYVNRSELSVDDIKFQKNFYTHLLQYIESKFVRNGELQEKELFVELSELYQCGINVLARFVSDYQLEFVTYLRDNSLGLSQKEFIKYDKAKLDTSGVSVPEEVQSESYRLESLSIGEFVLEYIEYMCDFLEKYDDSGKKCVSLTQKQEKYADLGFDETIPEQLFRKSAIESIQLYFDLDSLPYKFEVQSLSRKE